MKGPNFFIHSVLILLLAISGKVSAFEKSAFAKDSLPADTAKKEKVHSPKKAAIMSACLPGLGQIYNRKYWKVPIIYAGFGGLGFGFAWNHSIFKDYRDALRVRYDDDVNTIDAYPNYSDDDLVTLKNYYQRSRDLCIIGMAALYTLNVIDAAVDAHMFTFDVGEDLSLNWQPYAQPGPAGYCGIGLRFTGR